MHHHKADVILWLAAHGFCSESRSQFYITEQFVLNDPDCTSTPFLRERGLGEKLCHHAPPYLTLVNARAGVVTVENGIAECAPHIGIVLRVRSTCASRHHLQDVRRADIGQEDAPLKIFPMLYVGKP